MRRFLVAFTALVLLGLAAVLAVCFYEPAQLALMWVIWIGTAVLVFIAGSLGLLH